MAAVAFDGDCAKVLSDEEVSSVVGVPMSLSNGLPASDPGVIGGIFCQWRADGEGYQAIGVAVFPAAVVPESVRSSLGVPPDCSTSGYTCRSEDVFGDAVVSVSGSAETEVTSLLAAVGARASATPGEPRALPAGAWTVPDCDRVLQIAEDARGRGDLVPHQGDYYPSGLAWEVMSANGAAGYCALDNTSSVDRPTVIDISFGPGATPDVEAIERAAGEAVAVPGADAAWFFPEFTSSFDLVLVQSGPNTLTIGTSNLSEAEMVQLAEGFVEALG